MLSGVKSWVKNNPAVYDFLKSVKRRYVADHGLSYDFFDGFSARHDRRVRFLQIGANDGLRNDPIREFLVRDAWSGVLVEPLPEVFQLLRKNYPVARFPGLKFVNAAVTARDGETLSFWTFKRSFLERLTLEKRLEFLRKASFDRNHLLGFLDSATAAQSPIEEIKVATVTVASLARTYFADGRIDLLVIDAEGHEATILSTIDFAAFRPGAIFYESHHLGADKATIEGLLTRTGYRVRDIGGDTVAERI